MSDKQNIDEQEIERGGVEVEGHGVRGSYEPEQDVEGQGFRMGATDSEAPDSTDVSDADAAEESAVEGQAYKIRKPAEDVEGQGIRWGKNDSEAPENTDVNDSTDEPEVEGQGAKWI